MINMKFEDDRMAFHQMEKIIGAFKEIHKSIYVRFRKSARKYGVTVQQLAVIFYLNKNPNITLKQLGEHMMLSKSTVSGIIDRLVKQNIVIREIPGDDRRSVKLYLSEEFRKNHDIDRMKEKFMESLLDVIREMGYEETDKFISSIERFSSLMKK